MKPVVAFVPCDDNNLAHFAKLYNSLRKFHSEEELPIIKYDLKEVEDPMKWYKATPLVARDLLKEYECVIKLDADQIITGDISEAWKGEFDVAVVQNSNPREYEACPINLMDIHPFQYVNCGFVSMKSAAFVEHWLKLCQGSHFNSWQYREQDLLNIMVHYGDYNVKFLDASDTWYGLISKGYWPRIELRDDKLVLPKGEDWPVDGDKTIACIHFAGGNDPLKGNYRTKFSEEVVKWLDKQVS